MAMPEQRKCPLKPKPLDLPAQDEVEVRKIDTVTGDFGQDEGEPFWRVEIGGYCADFDHELAARNFAAAIAALDRHRAGDDTLREENERLREALTEVRDKWISNNSEGDDYEEGYDDGLKACHGIARAALTGRQG